MAVPTMSNNTPAPGSITWGAFSIQYLGVVYSIGSGSTAQRWVWWRYNGGSSVIEAGADIPTNLTDDDLVLFANKNGVGVRVQSTSFVDGELLVDGSIFAEALAANQINSQHIVSAGLDAGVIKFGTMSGDRIAASTITSTQIGAGAITTEELAAGAVTAQSIAAGAVTADAIAAGAISAESITSGTMSATVLLSGKIRTDVENKKRVEMDSLGLRLYSSLEKLLVDLPTDAASNAQFNGDATLSNATVTGTASFRGRAIIEPNTGDLQLSNGVTAPSKPPATILDHELLPDLTSMTAAPSNNVSDYSYVRDVAYTATDIFMLTNTGSPAQYAISRFPVAGGAQAQKVNVKDIALPAVPSGNANGWVGRGLAYDGSKLWLLATDSGDASLTRAFRLTTALAYDNNVVVFPASSGATSISGADIVSGIMYYGGTSYASSQYTPFALGVRLSDGVVTMAYKTGPASSNPAIGFTATAGDWGDGITRFIFNRSSSALVMYSEGTGFNTLTVRDNDAFEMGTDGSVGTSDPLHWNSIAGQFEQWDSSFYAWGGTQVASQPLKRKKFTGINWTTESSAWSASYVWRDSLVAGTGTHQTTEGTRAPFTMKKRYRLTLQSDSIPNLGGNDDPNAVTFLLGRGPNPTMYPVGGTLADGVESLSLSSVSFTGTLAAGTPFPAVTNPGRLRSAKSDGAGALIDLKGDGSGRVGPLTWDSSGVALTSGVPDTGWVALTPTAGGDSAQGTQFPVNGMTGLNYLFGRKIGAQVYIRFSRDFATVYDMSANASADFGNRQILVLPAGWRPDANHIAMGRASVDTGVTIGFGIAGAVSIIGGYPRSYGAGTAVECTTNFIGG